MNVGMIEHSVDDETGNVCLSIGVIDNSINFRYSTHFKKVSAVSNTQYGYISLDLGTDVALVSPPWSGGVMLSTANDDKVSLSLEVLPQVVEWLNKYGVTVKDER